MSRASVLAHLVVAIAYPGSLATGWLINASFVFAALLCLWRAASSRSDRAAWVCIGAGLLCQAFADRYWKSFLADAPNVRAFNERGLNHPSGGSRHARPRVRQEQVDDLTELIAQLVVGQTAIAVEALVSMPHRDLAVRHASTGRGQHLAQLGL
jgi:hypothetical protein